jgi:HEAT repeat protein
VRKAAIRVLVIGSVLAASVGANAQRRSPARPLPTRPARTAAGPSLPPPTPPPAAVTSLKAHFGLDVALRLLRSSDPEERLRGVQRAAAIHSPEGLELLQRTVGNKAPGESLAPEGVARLDPRALLSAVRGLADWIDHPTARAALAAIASAPPAALLTRTSATMSDPLADDTQAGERVALARRQAAVALAMSDKPLAVEALWAAVRAGGAGQDVALEALRIHPPSAPYVFGGAGPTTPAMVALAGNVGDLRALDAILSVADSGTPPVRVAALSALGSVGDTRGIEAARVAAHDPEPAVRIAAAKALVWLETADAAKRVEELVADNRTVLEGLNLGQDVQDEGVTKAAAARAVASSNSAIRTAAVALLGRQTNPLALQALAALVGDPSLQGHAAYALARSPSAGALATIETVSRQASFRRVAARAYFVRRYTRGARSPLLDALLVSLASSTDGRDRALAMEARVALGETPLQRALTDADARVRRAAAMGALARPTPSSLETSMRRMAEERDEPTRVVLAAGLIDGDPTGLLAGSTLAALATGGGADAPLAAYALAQRADDSPIPVAEVAEKLLGSRDPIVRAHVARGLAANQATDATGRLAGAYCWEGNADVRRAIVAALASRSSEAGSAVRRDTLQLAADLDPDDVTRETARRALEGKEASQADLVREVAWIQLTAADGASLPSGETALLVRSDGLAVPIAFDEDGYALVPGVPPGSAHLRMAPRLHEYSIAAP